MINYARFIGISPESALAKTNNKFIKRFDLMQDLCKKESKSMSDYSPEELEDKWREAKGIISNGTHAA